jgi:hypothetical protein
MNRAVSNCARDASSRSPTTASSSA